jgi:hypothetical protein
MHSLTGYLRYLFGEPAGAHVGERPVAVAPGHQRHRRELDSAASCANT